jgi:hypothetical protein
VVGEELERREEEVYIFFRKRERKGMKERCDGMMEKV